MSTDSKFLCVLNSILSYLTFVFEYARICDARILQPNAHWLWGHEKEANFDRPSGEAYSEWHDTLPTPPSGEGKGAGAFRIQGALWVSASFSNDRLENDC